MYSPDIKFQIARYHQAEMLREAETHRMLKNAKANSPSVSKRMLSTAITLATIIVVLARLIGQSL